ncbi:MAG: hypothetical protein JNJ73_08170 [Hyphomonadaceae bacterium]|nr:hypothetical protein [Hyphomonadaceae bacterium]
MSKWSSARSNLLALAAVALALGACARDEGQASDSRAARASAIVDPEMRVDEVSQEEPGVARRVWRAGNDTARTIAGNLSVSLEEGRGGPLALAFATGVTIRAEQLSAHRANTKTGGPDNQTFAQLLGLPDQVDVRVYRVVDERVSQSASRGGLCGELRTTAMAVAEFVDDTRWVLRIAASRGEVAPGDAGGDPQVCGVFAYEQPQ